MPSRQRPNVSKNLTLQSGSDWRQPRTSAMGRDRSKGSCRKADLAGWARSGPAEGLCGVKSGTGPTREGAATAVTRRGIGCSGDDYLPHPSGFGRLGFKRAGHLRCASPYSLEREPPHPHSGKDICRTQSDSSGAAFPRIPCRRPRSQRGDGMELRHRRGRNR